MCSPLLLSHTARLATHDRPEGVALSKYRHCEVVSLHYHRGMRATVYMRRCLELAEIAALAGDTAVGALIVCGDEVVGKWAIIRVLSRGYLERATWKGVSERRARMGVAEKRGSRAESQPRSGGVEAWTLPSRRERAGASEWRRREGVEPFERVFLTC